MEEELDSLMNVMPARMRVWLTTTLRVVNLWAKTTAYPRLINVDPTRSVKRVKSASTELAKTLAME
jgi:hypothetical protein